MPRAQVAGGCGVEAGEAACGWAIVHFPVKGS